MAQGFLSYTRRDDAFFENRITALRDLLEQAVHVQTGEDRFRLFQDREGIATGERWEEKLGEALARSVLLLPVVTPSFLASAWCRRELDLFLGREAALGRDDLVLPVYLVTAPPLEAEEKRRGDPLAAALAARQRSDWRDLADMPLDRQRVRKAARRLAADIAAAMERAGEAKLPASEPAVLGTQAGAEEAALRAVSAPVPSARGKILWVDDAPENNRAEIAALREHGVAVEQVTDTQAALDCLCAPGAGITAVVSDMARPGDGAEGWTLLEAVRAHGHPQPVLIYAGRDDPVRAAGTLARGGQGYTTRAAEIVALALDAATHRERPP